MTLFRNSMRFQLREPGPAAAAAVVPEQTDEDVARKADASAGGDADTEDSNGGAVNTDVPAGGDADAAAAGGEPAAAGGQPAGEEEESLEIIAQEPVQTRKKNSRKGR